MKEKIRNWLKENWFKVSILLILGFAGSTVFYWNEWRPSKIRERCYAEAEFDKRSWQFNLNDEARNKFIDGYYWGCLKRFGLEK